MNLSLKTIALNERIVLDTGAGAAIAYVGSAEDALWMTMQIREGFLKYNARTSAPIIVRYGLNVGPVRVVNDINGQPSIAGEGINTAQSIMNLGPPNEILVSRAYFEATPQFTSGHAKVVHYSAVKPDPQISEHEAYSVQLIDGQKMCIRDRVVSSQILPFGLLIELAKISRTCLICRNWFFCAAVSVVLGGIKSPASDWPL